jgi:cytochrome c556
MSVRARRATAWCFVLAIAVAAGGAIAHDLGHVPNTPLAKAAAARHQNYKQMGGAFKAIMDELKKDQPDKAVVTVNAQKVKALAADLPHWFPKGSGAESGVKVQAKPQVWTDPQGFAAAARRLQGESAKLADVAGGDDLPLVKKQFAATGQACKGCHDKYRVPDKS